MELPLTSLLCHPRPAKANGRPRRNENVDPDGDEVRDAGSSADGDRGLHADVDELALTFCAAAAPSTPARSKKATTPSTPSTEEYPEEGVSFFRWLSSSVYYACVVQTIVAGEACGPIEEGFDMRRVVALCVDDADTGMEVDDNL